MKIVILDAFTTMQNDLDFNALEQFGALTVYERTKKEDVVERAKEAEILLVNKVVLTAEILAELPKLRYIGLLSTGYNVVDLVAARKRNIPVCNIPSYSTPSVAQLTFSLLLEIANGVGAHSSAVTTGKKWQNSADFCFVESPQIELDGKVFGVVGYGSIGKRTAAIAEALGMSVIAYSRRVKAASVGAIRQTNRLDEVLSGSDIISLHCPLDANNKGFINIESISKMKDGAIIINTARGGLLNEKDVADALNSGKLYALGADVLGTEPPSADNPLLSAKNVVITPHIAWASRAARARLIAIATENLARFISGATQNDVT